MNGRNKQIKQDEKNKQIIDKKEYKCETDNIKNIQQTISDNDYKYNLDFITNDDIRSSEHSKKFTKFTLNYKLSEVIGEGTFGKVYKTVKQGNSFAIKKINKNEDGIHITTIREIKFLRKLNHKNIINLLEINTDGCDLYLVFPFYQFDLYIYLKRNIPNKKEIIHIIKQISEGLKYLKKQNIIHRDLKSKNILLDFNLNIKIADFGMATVTNKNSCYSPGVVTLWYRPPEILLNMKYNFSCDIWGLGCILGELMQGWPLFPGNTEIAVLEYIVVLCGSINSKTLPGMKDFGMQIPQSKRNLKKKFCFNDEELVNLMDKILAIGPEKRPTIEEILQDKVFIDYDENFIQNISLRYETGYNCIK